jgi:hypothetical protein
LDGGAAPDQTIVERRLNIAVGCDAVLDGLNCETSFDARSSFWQRWTV